jgi:hypothetical protein
VPTHGGRAGLGRGLRKVEVGTLRRVRETGSRVGRGLTRSGQVEGDGWPAPGLTLRALPELACVAKDAFFL